MSFPTVALGEIFDIARGGSPRPIEDYITDDPDGLNWVLIGDATKSGKYIRWTEKRIKREGLKKSRAVEPGDFLLSNSMSFGRPYIMATHGCIHDGWLVLRNGSSHADPDYLYHLLDSQPVYREFVKRAPGTTVKNLNTEIVGETRIPLPPLPEQKRIAAILDQADSIRQKRAVALEYVQTLAGSFYREMFGDSEYPSSALADLGRVVTGSTPPTGQSTYFGGDVPFVTPGDLESGSPVKRTLTAEGAMKSRTVRAGSTLVCCIGATIGKMDVADFTSAFNQQINAVEWYDKVDPVFGFFSTRLLKDQIIFRGKGASTTLPILKKSEFQKLRIAVPPLAMQRDFASRVEKMEAVKGPMEQHLLEIDALFASLQHRAFRGEL